MSDLGGYTNYKDYFMSENLDDGHRLMSLIGYVLQRFSEEHATNGAVISPELNVRYGEIGHKVSIPEATASPEDVVSQLLPYFANCVNWNAAGALFNVTPPVNILSIAMNVLTGILNPNLAEDRSCGLLAYAERQLIVCLAELLKWPSDATAGMSCYGGKATNFYAIRNAVEGAKASLKEHFDIKKAFYITTDRGHPCQEEVALLQALSKDNIIITPTDHFGRMDISFVEGVIDRKIAEGGIFLGLTLNAGTTMEYLVDDIEGVIALRDKIQSQYSLDYKPLVHADAVLGWVWLFAEKIDSVTIHDKSVSPAVIDNVKKMYNQIRHLSLVDSMGFDFHKLGFAAYQSSFYLSKGANISSIDDLSFGELSPYKKTIELSRGAQGVISGLTNLLSLGYEGYINLIVGLVNAAHVLRESLDNHPRLQVLGKDSLGICSVVTFVPYKPFEEDKTNKAELEEINAFNKDFVKFVQERTHSGEANLHFSFSRSYIAPGSKLRYGGIKLYPTSPHLQGQRLEDVVSDILKNVDEFLEKYEQSSDEERKIYADGHYHPIF